MPKTVKDAIKLKSNAEYLRELREYQVTKLLSSQIDTAYSPIRKQIRDAFTCPRHTTTTIEIVPRHYPIRAYRRH